MKNFNEVVFESQNLTKDYPLLRAVDNVSMKILKGDIYGLIGPNGAGKTTLLRMICGLIFPSSGTMELLGESDETKLISLRKRMGMIVETPNLMMDYNAYDALLWHSKIVGADPINIPTLIELVGLEDTGRLLVKNFSLGMKQRLAIAQALINEPDLLILDEPTNGMDPEGIIEIRELLLRINSQLGTTIIISSHILSELAQLVSRIGIIQKGRLLDEISIEDINTEQSSYYELHVKNIDLTIDYLNREDIQFVNRDSHFKITPRSKISRIIEDLEELGVVVYSFSKKNQSLEDYYIEKLGGHNK